MTKPALPESLQVTPNIPRADQTLEQLEQERAWWQWKIDNAKELTVRSWAKDQLAVVDREIASRE